MGARKAANGKPFLVEKSDKEWKEQLGPQKYRILRQHGTERPGSHEYNKMHPSEGYFKCGGCGFPLYTASSKFRSSCGWPCFDQVVYTEEHGCHVGVKSGLGGHEIICNSCGGHLGHVFYGERCTPKNERH
eukprot:gnl/MRDRNA2_/MRDRNA2_123711_c0_seq1.p1 gnl/MRDRNA2_/MRDRNA2_123711_c0~~gnl/MRDRNA2_/MRDRNA2_123711_c0_seq1.p1  ORF type:complete len:131 (+),score=13.98 gnl/MRDRNA2_/MRDRNA2_123711_c0_seq1:177-569(+)